MPAELLARSLRIGLGAEHPASRMDDGPDGASGIDSMLVSLVEERWRSQQDWIWERRKESLANIEFFEGRHWSWWDGESRRFRDTAPSKEERKRFPRITLNVFQRIARTAISRFLSSRPFPHVDPGSQDQRVIDGARIANDILSGYEWRAQQVQSKLATLWPHLLLNGSAFLKLTWNPRGGERYDEPAPLYELDEKGDPIPQRELDVETGEWYDVPGQFVVKTDPETGEPLMRPDFEGCNKLRVVSSTNVIVDPSCGEEFDDAGWLIEESWHSPAALQRDYPGRYVQPKTRADDPASPGYAAKARPRDDESACVLECWLKAGNHGGLEFEKDYRIIICDGQVLDSGDSPLDYFPYRYIRASRVPGQLAGSTFMSDVRRVNHLFNLTASQVGLSNALAGFPVWSVHTTAKLKQQALMSTPGGVFEHATEPGALPPTRHEGRSVASSVMGFLTFLYQTMQDVAGQHAGGMLGGQATGVESAVHAEALNERDLAALGSIAQEVAEAMEWWGYKSLKNWQRFKPERQQVTITGPLSSSETVSFGGCDVHKSFVINVAPDLVLPQGRAAKLQRNLLLYQLGGFSLRTLLQRVGAEVGEEATLDTLHANVARDENRMISEGRFSELWSPVYFELMKTHDPEIHYEEHLRYILAPDTPLEMKLQTLQHLMVHDFILDAAAAQQAQAPVPGAAGTTEQTASSSASAAGGGAPPTEAEPAPAAEPDAEEMAHA